MTARLSRFARTALASFLLLGAVLIGTSLPAPADTVTMRHSVSVAAGLVTLGDLFDNLNGKTAAIAVFRAPDPGQSGVVSVERVAAAARQHGVVWRDDGGHAEVSVTRTSTRVTLETISQMIEESVRQRLGARQGATVSVSFDAGGDLHLDARSSGTVRIARLDHDPYSGNFTAHIQAGDGPDAGTVHAFKGRALETLKVPVLTRTVMRGETVGAADLRLAELPRARVARTMLLEQAAIIGMAARRTLTEGQGVGSDDLEQPRLVRRNRPVTVVFESAGLALSTRAQALGDAGEGEVVTVINTRSRRMIETVVIGPDKVAVIGAEPRQTTSRARLAQAATGSH